MRRCRKLKPKSRASPGSLGLSRQPPDVLLNLQANETTLRQSPLGEYRFLHFATHADLSDKVQGIKEPLFSWGRWGTKVRTMASSP